MTTLSKLAMLLAVPAGTPVPAGATARSTQLAPFTPAVAPQAVQPLSSPSFPAASRAGAAAGHLSQVPSPPVPLVRNAFAAAMHRAAPPASAAPSPAPAPPPQSLADAFHTHPADALATALATPLDELVTHTNVTGWPAEFQPSAQDTALPAEVNQLRSMLATLHSNLGGDAVGEVLLRTMQHIMAFPATKAFIMPNDINVITRALQVSNGLVIAKKSERRATRGVKAVATAEAAAMLSQLGF